MRGDRADLIRRDISNLETETVNAQQTGSLSLLGLLRAKHLYTSILVGILLQGDVWEAHQARQELCCRCGRVIAERSTAASLCSLSHSQPAALWYQHHLLFQHANFQTGKRGEWRPGHCDCRWTEMADVASDIQLPMVLILAPRTLLFRAQTPNPPDRCSQRLHDACYRVSHGPPGAAVAFANGPCGHGHQLRCSYRCADWIWRTEGHD